MSCTRQQVNVTTDVFPHKVFKDRLFTLLTHPNLGIALSTALVRAYFIVDIGEI